MFNKENVLFWIVGLLMGLIVGFMFANSVNQNPGQATIARQNANLPVGHPDLAGSDQTSGQTGALPEVLTAAA